MSRHSACCHGQRVAVGTHEKSGDLLKICAAWTVTLIMDTNSRPYFF